jgi:glycosyltransferase involved in cell wall biosynthesis
MPFAVRKFDMSGYDVIISNSHSVAKGIRKNPNQLQICYCHTPMRYAWDLQSQYLKESGLDSGIKGMLAKYILNRLKKWDYAASQKVNYFIANSNYIKDRIKRAYNKDSSVIYPPVDIDSFQLKEEKDNYFLAVSRMVPYKRMDLIVDAFSDMGLPLVVIGDGPDFSKLKAKAGSNVELLGYQEKDVLADYMQRAKAFVFAAEEDFGIVPVEAQACGTPVIAFGKGGVTESVLSVQGSEHASPTGIFFKEQSPASLINAVKKFETIKDRFHPHEIRKNAERFSAERFSKELKYYISQKINDFFE